MNAIVSMAALLALAQGASDGADRIARLQGGCDLIQQAYPLLILAVMGEGPLDCGEPDSGVVVDCNANDTPEQRARRAQRFEIRQRQEAVFKQASDACNAWAADRQAPALQDAVVRTFRAARAIGTDLPREVQD